MAKSHIPIIGLIGGVGSGKSAVARWLADHHCVQLVDADAVGHAVLKQGDVRSQLRDIFGEPIFQDGQISRPQLAALVFGDAPEQIAARRALEAIVHPVMRGLFEAAFETARQTADVELIVFDAALLLDSGWADVVDIIVYVDVPADERLRRVAASRGWSAEELQRREASQLSLAQKRDAADIVIDNSGTVDAAGRQLEAFLHDAGHLPPSTPGVLAPETVTH